MTNRDAEHDELWRRSVAAISTFSYVGAGFRNAVPRLSHLAPALDELAEVVAAGPPPVLAHVLAGEAGQLRERFAVVVDSLNATLARIDEFIGELESRGAGPED